MLAADSAEKLRPCDARRVYEAAHELEVVPEVKELLRLSNPSAYAEFCTIDRGESQNSATTS